MSGYDSNKRAFVITDEGQANIFKQTVGANYSIIGYALVRDTCNWFGKQCDVEKGVFSALKRITFEDVLDNATVIFKGVSYAYSANTYSPVGSQYETAKSNPASHLFALNYKYDQGDDETAPIISYETVINKSDITLSDTPTDDMSFDAILFFAQPYKQETQDAVIPSLDKQDITLFAIQYFGEEKILVLNDQHPKLVITIKVQTSIEGGEAEPIDVTLTEYGDGIKTLHVVNNATNNTVNLDRETYGTVNRMMIASVPADDAASYDSFAKLNIMSIANAEDTVPQMMFSLAKDDASKSWNGQRLTWEYTSGNKANLFRLFDVKGASRYRLNFELIGQNNIYRGMKDVYGNSFIYSRENELSYSAHDNTFINSDDNFIQAQQTNKVSFTDSNNNSLLSGTPISGKTPGIYDLKFYGTDYATVAPASYVTVKGLKNAASVITGYSSRADAGFIHNSTIMASDAITLIGSNNSAYNGAHIASPSARHALTQGSEYLLEIGNRFGFTNNNDGSLIAIGQGLVQLGNKGEKTILGHYNLNNTDTDDVFIVGDGFLKQDYLNKIASAFSANNSAFYSEFLNAGSPTGDWYRHNLMVANRKGWMGISNFYHPGNSARYGFSGISAYRNGELIYDIPFSDVYAKLNVYDSMKEFQTTIDSYEKKVENVTKSAPVTKVIILTESMLTNGGFSLNDYCDKTFTGSNVLSPNTLINLTYQTSAASGKAGYSANVSAGYSSPVTQGIQTSTHSIVAYNALQFIYQNESYDNAKLSGFFRMN